MFVRLRGVEETSDPWFFSPIKVKNEAQRKLERCGRTAFPAQHQSGEKREIKLTKARDILSASHPRCDERFS